MARRYRVVDYLKAVGVDVGRIKEIQIMGPKETSVIIASGKELRSHKGRDLMFRFGSIVGGKPIPVVPDKFGNGVMPDKMGAMMVYIDKKPPVLSPARRASSSTARPVDGVPYFGEPMRGGVRIYVDDRLSLAIKPQLLQEAPAETAADGTKRWKLTAILKQNGVDLSKVKEAWAIADERRKQKFNRAELDALTLTMDPAHKNQILVGDGTLRVTRARAAFARARPERAAPDPPRREHQLAPGSSFTWELVPVPRPLRRTSPKTTRSRGAAADLCVFPAPFNGR